MKNKACILTIERRYDSYSEASNPAGSKGVMDIPPTTRGPTPGRPLSFDRKSDHLMLLEKTTRSVS